MTALSAILNRLALVVLASLAVTATPAQDYPNRPIRITTPFAAGAVSDITLRIVADRLSARLGVPVIVDNQPGGGGAAAARAAIAAPPDGYTLTLLSNATAVSVGLFKHLPFDPRTDFTPIIGISDFAYIFVTPTGSTYRSLQDVIAAARANPGKLNFGTSAAGTSNHLTALLFKSVLGLDFVVVPYRGPSELSIALLRNDLDVVVNAYGGLRAALDAGQIRAIAASTATRSAQLPDVPTAQEAGVANFEVSSWNALYAPAKTPREALRTLNRELKAVLAEDDIRKRFFDLGIEARPSQPQELEKRMRSEIERWGKVIVEAGIERQ
jgi:tripartite-type tricarboxylate transporter receptor subunit TctC